MLSHESSLGESGRLVKSDPSEASAPALGPLTRGTRQWLRARGRLHQTIPHSQDSSLGW
jgi:hypothetical protein